MAANLGAECRRVRDRLWDAEVTTAGQGTPRPAAEGAAAMHGDVAGHLAACPECAAFVRRLRLAREALRGTVAAIEPDASFPARVLARLGRPSELIGWAAFRALPAAVGLALVLALLGLASPAAAPPSPLLEAPAPSSDQLLAWSSLSPEVWP